MTGVYGTGKSTVTEEIAGILEARGEPYAAIDLDWLWWANVPQGDHDDPVLLRRNLAAIVANDRAAGVRSFVLAGAIGHAGSLASIRGAIELPLVVIRLVAPLPILEARLAAAPTGARAQDLAVARERLATARGVGLEDATVENVGPVRETALAVLHAAGWA